MKNYIKVKLDGEHCYNCSGEILARQNENRATAFQISLTEGMLDKWFYIEFVKPDNTKISTPRLEVDKENKQVVYEITNALTDQVGKIVVEIVIRDENNLVWKSYKKNYQIVESANASEEIKEENPDFITEAQKLLDEIKEIGGSGGGSGGISKETDPTVPQHVKEITEEDIEKWNSGTGTAGTTDYEDLENKPKINNVELTGNKTLDDLGIQPKGNYSTIDDLTDYIGEHKEELKGDKGDKGEDGSSGVYVGSGEMPEDCNVQIDPTGETAIIPTKTSELENDSNYATETFVTNKIAEAELSGGNTEIDLSDYATKEEIPTKVSQLQNDSGFITNIPEEYAKKTDIPNIEGLATEQYVNEAIANIDIPEGGAGASSSEWEYLGESTPDNQLLFESGIYKEFYVSAFFTATGTATTRYIHFYLDGVTYLNWSFTNMASASIYGLFNRKMSIHYQASNQSAYLSNTSRGNGSINMAGANNTESLGTCYWFPNHAEIEITNFGIKLWGRR